MIANSTPKAMPSSEILWTSKDDPVLQKVTNVCMKIYGQKTVI